MKKITKDTLFISSIDTFQTKDSINNRNILIDTMPGQSKKYIDNDIIRTVWNPNHNGIIKKLTETEKEIVDIYSRAQIINTSVVKMNRIDINTDIDIEFTEIDKELDFLFLIITEGKNNLQREWGDKSDFKKDSYWFKSQYLDINFYNKSKDSMAKNEKCEFPTRLELRFKKIKSQDKKLHIQKAIDLYNESFERLEYAENTRIKMLCDEWDNFITDNPKATLTHFVVKHEKDIFTRRILEGLYKHVGLSGSISSWIKKFRQGYKLELITANEVKELVKRITISLKRYKNN